MQPLTSRDVGRYAGSFLLGVLVALVGTGVHRGAQPWGLVLALAMVVSAAVLVRAWTGWTGMLAVGLGLATAVAVLAGRGPGGDVLVTLDPVGIVWYGSAGAVALAALAPRRWFSNVPVGTSGTAQE